MDDKYIVAIIVWFLISVVIGAIKEFQNNEGLVDRVVGIVMGALLGGLFSITSLLISIPIVMSVKYLVAWVSGL